MKIKRKDLEQIEKALQKAILAKRNNDDDLWALNGDDTKAVRDALVIAENILDGIK